MSKAAIEVSGIDEEVFYTECRTLHQTHGTTEYAFVLTELPTFKKMYGNRILEMMQPAVNSFREARQRHLHLYPGVNDTLTKLKESGVIIAAFTESKAFYTNYRFRKLGLDEKIDFLYSPEDHSLPADSSFTRKYPEEYYELKKTKHLFTPTGEHKPNPHILLSIIKELKFDSRDAIYVGDNLLKDVCMAQDAGVTDVFAEYGAAQHREAEYDLLKTVTHWTPEMVAEEQAKLKPGVVTPSYTLTNSFSQIIEIMEEG